MDMSKKKKKVEVIARYSASIEDLDTVCCFLDFQEINEPPRNTQNPITDLRVSTQPAQSEFEKAFN
jgi:hypothetical protein